MVVMVLLVVLFFMTFSLFPTNKQTNKQTQDEDITLPETREECEQAVPMALTGLMLSYQQMQQITDYCKQVWCWRWCWCWC